ncbi:hypothetical protein A2V82_15265 [candidate division KSB1 bacterium RBG_16_48_16]|nr:MAG: hypothetical protein A2V82_15265 [candidate division KSB1 bacterium RBG_16_48_16]
MVDQLSRIKDIVEGVHSHRSHCIAVTSGKGGVGKSNIALNLALALVKHQKKVVLVDADSNLANLDVLLGVNPNVNLLSIVLDDLRVEEVIYHHTSGLDFIPNSSGNRNWQALSDAIKPKIFEVILFLKRHYDFVILDTAAGLAPMSIDLTMRADEIFMTTTPEPTAISDTYAMIKVLDSHKKNLPIKLVLNMVYDASEVADVYQRLSLVLQHFLGIRIELAGFISYDERVRRAIHLQKPFILSFPETAASEEILQLAGSVLSSRMVVSDFHAN